MKKQQFNSFLSCLMGYAWHLKRGREMHFKKALRYTWRVAKEELNYTALPFITSTWDF